MFPSRFLFLISAGAAIVTSGAAAPADIAVKPDLVREHFAGPGFQFETFHDYAPKSFSTR